MKKSSFNFSILFMYQKTVIHFSLEYLSNKEVSGVRKRRYGLSLVINSFFASSAGTSQPF